MAKLGITKLMGLIMFGIGVGMKSANALEDGKVSLSELFSITPDLMAIHGIVKDFPEIKQEVADLDAEERAQISKEVQEKFDIADDDLEAAIEGGVRLGIAVLDEIALFGNLKKKSATTGGNQTGNRRV